MIKNNQSGRSMLVMLGILILAVLAANKLLNKIHQYRVFKQASSLTMQAKMSACEFDRHQYTSYAEMLDEKGHVPDGLNYANDKFEGIDGIVYQFVENTQRYFTLKISNLDNRSCTDLVTSRWFNNTDTQGFMAMQIEDSRWFQIGDERGARAYCTNHHDGVIKVRFLGCGASSTN